MRGELAEVDSYFHALSPLAIRLYWWYVSRMWFNLFVTVAGSHMLLAFIENPSNLEYESLSAGPFAPGKEDLGFDTLLVYTKHSHRDFEITMIFHSIELLFVAVYVIDLMAYHVIVGRETFFRETWVRIQIFAISFIGLNTLYCLIVTTFQDPALMKYAPQLSRLMRPFVLMYKMRHVRNVFDSILQSIPHILNVMVLLALMMIIFGAFFFTIFGGIDLHTCKFFAQAVLNTTHNISTKHGGFTSMEEILFNHPNETEVTGTCDQYMCFCSSWGQNCTNYFNSIFNSLLHLFIMLTTANFPDIMIPVSQCAWPFTLLFISFLATGLFFLLNLLLAVVYNKFQQKAESRLESQLDNSKAAAR